MRTRFLIALPLAAAMCVPALSQQTTEQQQPAAPAQVRSTTNSNAQASQPATGERQPLAYERREGFWGKINPFARKRYVQRQIEPIANRTNELDELTARNTRDITDVDARAQEGIRTADLKATEADRKAVAAGNRAQLAHNTAQQASLRLTSVEQAVTNIDQYSAVNEVEIRFRPGQLTLSKAAKDALDQVAQSLKDRKGVIVEVQGFSAGRGQSAIANSRNLADAVARYLVLNHEIPLHRIYVVGMGNSVAVRADGTKAKRTTGGRVEVSVMRNAVADLAGNMSAPMAAQQQTAPPPVSPK